MGDIHQWGAPSLRSPRPEGGAAPAFSAWAAGAGGLHPATAVGHPAAGPRGCRGWKRAVRRGDGGRKVGVRPRVRPAPGPECGAGGPGAWGSSFPGEETGPERDRQAPRGTGRPGGCSPVPPTHRRCEIVVSGADTDVLLILGDQSKIQNPACTQ